VKIALTFDVEVDCPPYNDTTQGITVGIPKVLTLLDKYKIKSTFFVTGEMAQQFPNEIKNLAKTHEIGSHGYYHEKFDELTDDKLKALKKSKLVLEKTIGKTVIGFRAPHLRVCDDLFVTLKELGFKYDASMASFMMSHRNINPGSFKTFKLGIPNVILRFPGGMRKFKKYCKNSEFPVLYFHPWEMLNMKKILPKTWKGYYYRWHNWINTGDEFNKRLDALLEHLKKEGFEFVALGDLIKNE
jgi:peptidoglycan/xylan/chitin deacetylase (PgdA/CDA1 family)